jgi:hypothetical protein
MLVALQDEAKTSQAQTLLADHYDTTRRAAAVWARVE